MKAKLIAIGVACCWAPSLSYAAKTHVQELQSLTLDARVEQSCAARAIGLVGREHPKMAPDEIVSNSFAEPVLHDSTFIAPGAAVRSRGNWYHITYKCETSADGLNIVSFSYTLGSVVPRDQWSKHYLVP